MHPLLRSIESPDDFRDWPIEELVKLADEVRDVLTNLVATRTAHYASNLGVVELCLALHSVFDFRRDRLIWDTGHQVYPHKLVTGRYHEFGTIRSRGGLMGYPKYDLVGWLTVTHYDQLIPGGKKFFQKRMSNVFPRMPKLVAIQPLYRYLKHRYL